MQKVAIENYLGRYQKFFVFYLIITSFFASLYVFRSDAGADDFLISFFGFLGLLFTVSIFLAKKGFIKNNEKLYQALIIRDRIIYKELIRENEFSIINIKKRRKAEFSLFVIGSLLSLILNENAYSLYLINQKTKNKKSLMSFTDIDATKKAIEFITQYSMIEIQNIDLLKPE